MESRSEENAVGISSASIFPTRKREAFPREVYKVVIYFKMTETFSLSFLLQLLQVILGGLEVALNEHHLLRVRGAQG